MRNPAQESGNNAGKTGRLSRPNKKREIRPYEAENRLDRRPEDDLQEEAFEKPQRISSLQKKTMRRYREIGMSEREIAELMGLTRGTVHYWTKEIVVPPMNHNGTAVSGPSSTDASAHSISETTENRIAKVTVEQGSNSDPSETYGLGTSTNDRGASGWQSRRADDDRSVDQRFPIDMRKGIVVKWDPALIFKIRSRMDGSGYEDPGRWWDEYAVPRLLAINKAEEYVEFPKPIEGDAQTRISHWFHMFQKHMDAALEHYKVLDEIKKDAFNRMWTQAHQNSQL